MCCPKTNSTEQSLVKMVTVQLVNTSMKGHPVYNILQSDPSQSQ